MIGPWDFNLEHVLSLCSSNPRVVYGRSRGPLGSWVLQCRIEGREFAIELHHDGAISLYKEFLDPSVVSFFWCHDELSPFADWMSSCLVTECKMSEGKFDSALDEIKKAAREEAQHVRI